MFESVCFFLVKLFESGKNVNNENMAKVLNNILCGILTFAVAFCWAYYGTKLTNLSVAVAVLAAAAVCALLWHISASTPKKSKIKELKKNASDLAFFLAFNTDNASLFSKLLRYKGYEVTVKDEDNLFAEKNGEKILCAVRFGTGALSAEEMRKTALLSKRTGCGKIFLFTLSADRQGTELLKARGIDIAVFDAENTYALLSDCGYLPEYPHCKEVQRHIVLEYALNKKRFGWYFASALFLTAVSVISYFPVYTLVWATVLAVISFYCLFNKRFNSQKTENSL